MNDTTVQRRMAAAGTQPGRAPMVSKNSSPLPNIDLVKLAWDARYLLILGTLIGLGLGYFHFVQAPAVYRSAAQVQIVESTARNLPVESLEGGIKTRNFADEALVMRSEQILVSAAQIGELASTPEFAGMVPEQIAGYLSGEELVVAQALDSTATSIIQIQYDSTSATTSRRVVQSIVDAYALHLKNQYRNVGQETIDLIQQARNEVLTKLDELEQDFSEFKVGSNLIYRGNETTSIHRDNADRYIAQKLDLLIRKAKLSGVLESAKRSMVAKRPYESILLALNSAATVGWNANNESLQPGLSLESKWELEKIRSKPLLSMSERMRQDKLLPLEMERETLVDNFGNDHPAVETLDRRIAILEKTIRSVAQSEKELNREVDEAMAAANAEVTGSIQTETDPQQRLFQQIKFAIGALNQQMDALDAELEVVTTAYDAEMEMARQESDSEIQSQQYAREMNRQQQLYDRIVARLDEVNLMSGGDGLKIFPLNTAKTGYQVAPSLAKSLLMGGFLGCILAAGLAYLRELSDRSYHSARDIAEHTRLPIIGHVPVLKPYKPGPDEPGQNFDSRLVAFFQGKSQKAEAFRAIRTAIYFSNQSGDNQVLQVTSSTPSDGKSTIAANIAIAIAQSGRTVLLMDGDLRRPRVGKLLGIDEPKGTAWAIEQCSAGNEKASELVQEAIHSCEVQNLSVMSAGEKPENPSELLSSPNFDRLLEVLRKKFDMIILDTPPLLAVSDPANVASRVDGVMMVVRLRKNIKPAVAQSTRMLETLEANVLGIVVNGVGSRAARGYGRGSGSEGESNYGASYQYGYGYSYGYTYGYTDNNRYNAYYEENRSSKRKSSKKAKKQSTEVAGKTSSKPPGNAVAVAPPPKTTGDER